MKNFTLIILIPMPPHTLNDRIVKFLGIKDYEKQIELPAINFGHAEEKCKEKYPECKIIEIKCYE